MVQPDIDDGVGVGPGPQVRSWEGGAPGPAVVLLGGVHGDERCGVRALDDLAAALDAGHAELLRGRLTVVARTNPLACARGTRAGMRDLNRSFVPRDAAQRQDYEDEVTARLAPLLAAHDVLVDLHSASAATPPFAMIGLVHEEDLAGVVPGAPPAGAPSPGAADELALAFALGVEVVVEGWYDVYAADLGPGATGDQRRVGVGTNEYMRAVGGIAVTVECGEHADPESAVVAGAVARRALEHLGMMAAPPSSAPGRDPDRVLRTRSMVRRTADGDRFTRSWESFETVSAGEVIGIRADGTPVHAGADGAVMFPDPDADVGQEWFYLAVRSDRQG